MSNKIELLAPAGNMNALKMAVIAGADAVYLSGKNFGARAFAGNFSNEELIEAVEFAHIRGVKVYVTINTIVFEDEFAELKKYLDFLSTIYIDAVIVQDLGVVKYIREHYPNIIIHASTQMNIFSEYGSNILTNLGVKRVVLARETSLDVIKTIKNIETEVFCHGALCFAYSGNCLMSYIIGKRSGNRGTCAQPCRKKYSLKVNNKDSTGFKSLISMKDLMTIDRIGELIKSNITSLKIEGRMKSPEYVYTIVKKYRYAIDKYYQGEKYKLSKADYNQIKVVFNREFTKGYLFNEKNKYLVNNNNVNHQGIEIGKIEKRNDKEIYIRLFDKLSYGDGIRIKDTDFGFNVNQMYVKNNLVKFANEGNLVKIPIKNKISVNQIVLKTQDYNLIENTTNLLKKIPSNINITMEIMIKIGEPVRLTIKDFDKHKVVILGNIVNNSETNNISEERIIEQLSKLGSTAYILKKCYVNMDNNIDIKISEINELRRKAVEKLNQERIKTNYKQELQLFETNKPFNKKTLHIDIVTHTSEQYQVAEELKDVNINVYTDNDLTNKYQYLNRGISYENKIYEDSIIHSLNYIGKNNTLSIYGNVSNTESIKMYNYLNVFDLYLSTELSLSQIKMMNLNNINSNIGIMAYGKRDMMITNYCIISSCLNQEEKKCNLCRKNQDFVLVDEYHNEMNILTNEDCQNRILEPTAIDYYNNIFDYIDNGINKILLVFTTESKEETYKIINKYKKGLFK